MWRAVARSPLRGKVLTRFRYHRHYFKYIVRYPYGDDATQFRTLRERHMRSTWVPKLFYSSCQVDKNQVSLLQTHPPTHSQRESHTDIRRGMLLGFTRVYAALLCSTESRRSQGARQKPSHKQYFRVRARAPSHRTTLQHLVW
jgi:hypothetical protein